MNDKVIYLIGFISSIMAAIMLSLYALTIVNCYTLMFGITFAWLAVYFGYKLFQNKEDDN